MKNKIKEILKNKAVSFYIFLTVAVFVALLIHDWQIGFNKIDWDAIWIEAHGMFFDIIVLGLLLTIYNHFRDKEEKIERYMDEIDDFRMWNEREAAHRIRGILKRLEKLGVTNVKLDRCHLCNLEMIAQRLSGALLHKTDLNSTDLTSVEMNDCKINRSIFTQSNLTSANLSNSIIRNSDFSNATFYSAKLFNVRFEDCVFSECNFQYADLRGAKFLKIKEGAFLGAKAFEYQKEFFLDNGVDTKEIIFEPNPKDFEDYEEFYIQGDIVNAKKGEFLLKNKNLIKDVIKKV